VINGEIVVVDDIAEAFTQVVIADYQGRANSNFSIAVSGGPTAKGCYERLAQVPAESIGWWDIDVYWGDERCVPPDDPDSNERMVREALLSTVGAVNAIYPMRCDDGVEAYQMKVANLGYFDLVHLGLGPDGHTASLFPKSAALNADPGLLVAFNEDPSGRNPHRRMTLTYSGIAKSRHVVFTVSGASKKEAFKAIRDGADLPASKVVADQVTWLVDRQAASED